MLTAVLAETIRRVRGTSVIPHTAAVIRYHQRRNAAATKSHKKQRHKCVI